jgi:hypothetical protein
MCVAFIWFKSLMRKWFNIWGKLQDFRADFDAGQGTVNASLPRGVLAELNLSGGSHMSLFI